MDVTPLFVFGVARSGTNLIARMLNAHPQINIALDPLLPVFRSLRDSIVLAHENAALRHAFPPASAIPDYYGAAAGPTLLKLILEEDLNIKIDPGEFGDLRDSIAARAAMESADLPLRFTGLQGETYRDLIANAVMQIAGKEDEKITYAGFKEVWTTEFLFPLARAFPTARFFVIERDPRDVLASLQKLAKENPSQRAHAVSYLRHWRKNSVIARHFMKDAALSDRLMLVRYETLASSPRESAHEFCRFLDIPYMPEMIHLEKTIDQRTGKPWAGNSSFEQNAAKITTRPVGRWRTHLSTETVRLTEFICGPEMKIAAYDANNSDWPGPEVLSHYMAIDKEPGSWRSDTGDVVADFGFEMFRRLLLEIDPEKIDKNLIRRGFLFRWVFDEARQRQSQGTPKPEFQEHLAQ